MSITKIGLLLKKPKFFCFKKMLYTVCIKNKCVHFSNEHKITIHLA